MVVILWDRVIYSNILSFSFQVNQQQEKQESPAVGGRQFQKFVVGEQSLKKKDWHNFERLDAEKLRIGL